MGSGAALKETTAGAIIDVVDEYAAAAQKRFGTRMFFSADELYLRAGRPLPPAEYYEEFRQLENGLLDHVKETGDYLLSRLNEISDAPKVAQVRGRGLSAAVEFTDPASCDKVLLHLTSKGLLVGRSGCSIFFKPPYVIEKADVDLLAQALKEAVSQL